MKKVSAKPVVQKKEKSYEQQFKEAKEFFNPAKFSAKAAADGDGDNYYADKDGLIEFIVAAELVDNEEVMDKIGELKKILIALTSIVTKYVNGYANEYGQEYKTDVQIWTLAMNELPLMGPSAIDEQTYFRQLAGINIAADFIQFIVGVVASEGSSALGDFQKFLEKQGDSLRFGVENNNDFYRTMTVGVAVEVFMLEDKIFYAPKIKQYRVDFDKKSNSWSSACASGETVEISFNYLNTVNIFDYEALENPGVKKEFDDFIASQQKNQIEKATTFFNGNFPPPQKEPSPNS